MFDNHLKTDLQLHYTQDFRLYLKEKTVYAVTEMNRLMILG